MSVSFAEYPAAPPTLYVETESGALTLTPADAQAVAERILDWLSVEAADLLPETEPRSDIYSFKYVSQGTGVPTKGVRIGRLVSMAQGVAGVNLGILELANEEDGIHDEPRFKWFASAGVYSLVTEAEHAAALQSA